MQQPPRLFQAQVHPPPTPCTVRGTVVVFDRGPLTSWFNRRQLSAAGLDTQHAGSLGELLGLLQSLPRVAFILVDFESIGSDPHTVSTIRRHAPRAPILGTSVGDRWDDFATLGILDYLEQPWSIEDLALALPHVVHVVRH